MRHSIIIADDEKIALHILEKYLLENNENLSIIKAFDGKQTISLAKNIIPDTIIFNWNMPLMKGKEILKEIKKQPETKDIPLIAIVSGNPEDEMKKAINNGQLDFIKKPINKIELKGRIHSALKLRKALINIKNQKQTIDSHINELNKLSIIVKETDNAVLIISPEGDLEWANEGFKRMYGLTLEDYINRFGSNIYDASFNKQKVKEKINQLLIKKISVSYISFIQGNFTEDKWVHTTLTPIFDEDYNIDKIVAIETDITKNKKYEINLEKKNNEMSELTNKLKAANKELILQKNLIQEERNKTDDLIESILPHHVASQLKSIGFARPRNYRRATIMFTDFKGFTKSCEHLKPDDIVKYLHGFFTVFDDIIIEHYIEKIKTIGDAYMCVGGIPLRNRSNPFDVTIAALKIQYFMNNIDEYDKNNELPRWNIRLGIHTGPLTAGVVGKIKFAYDVWGDSVNIASRMESTCEVGRVNISEATFEQVKDFFETEYRGEIQMKNRGKMGMYFVNRIKKQYSLNQQGTEPNEDFKKFLHSL